MSGHATARSEWSQYQRECYRLTGSNISTPILTAVEDGMRTLKHYKRRNQRNLHTPELWLLQQDFSYEASRSFFSSITRQLAPESTRPHHPQGAPEAH